jgi:hypothetical protein
MRFGVPYSGTNPGHSESGDSRLRRWGGEKLVTDDKIGSE